MVWVAPSSCANARRAGLMSMATIVVQPMTRAAMIALNPTDPVPKTASDEPGRTAKLFITAPAPV